MIPWHCCVDHFAFLFSLSIITMPSLLCSFSISICNAKSHGILHFAVLALDDESATSHHILFQISCREPVDVFAYFILLFSILISAKRLQEETICVILAFSLHSLNWRSTSSLSIACFTEFVLGLHPVYQWHVLLLF